LTHFLLEECRHIDRQIGDVTSLVYVFVAKHVCLLKRILFNL
jgi:hypothetical protein